MTKLCAEVKLLLPWFVNKSLEPEQKVVIYSHLTTCSQCKKDLAFFIQLQQEAPRFIVKPEQTLKNEILKKIIEEISPNLESNMIPTLVQNVFQNPAPLKVFQSVVRLILHLYRHEYNKLTDQLKSGLLESQI